MELIIDIKYDKKKDDINAEMESQLLCDDKFIELTYNFKIDTIRYGKSYDKDCTTTLRINLKNGDFDIIKHYTENNKTTKHTKKNNFLVLSDIISDAFLGGHRNERFWGVKLSNYYHKVSDHIINKFEHNYEGERPVVIENYHQKMYSAILGFHLMKNKIKPHDNIFFNIIYDYPKKKFLDVNENKYVPSVLDFYGIKNKYFITEINKNGSNIVISTLKCLTDMFGDNYIDFLRQIPLNICDAPIRPRVKYTLKNNSEKNNMVRLINNMVKDEKIEIVKKIYKLMELFDFMEKNHIKVKFKKENTDQYDDLYNTLNEYKKFYSRNFIYKYIFPENFVNIVEDDITYKSKTYSVKILKSELDFLNESVKMKNCLLTHFMNGYFYIYLSVFDGEKTVDIQVRNNKIHQIFGKANSEVSKDMKEVGETILHKINKFIDLKWEKVMEDFTEVKQS